MSKFLTSYVKEIKAPEEGVISFTLTKRVVDRDSEVIEPKGIKLDNFKKNPVFLWAHDMYSPPIGKVLVNTIVQDEEKIEADVQFDLDDAFARMIYDKYKKKILNAGSIRFIPLTFGKEPVMPKQQGATIVESELLEFSAVPIPANAAALAKAFEGDETPFKDKIKSFLENDNFDHTPEGWVDMLNKLSEEKQMAEQEPEQEEEEEVIVEPNQFTSFTIKTDEVKANDIYRIVQTEDNFHLEKMPTFEEEMIKHPYFKAYNLNEWDGIAKAMVDLISCTQEDLPDDAADIYEFLSTKYIELEKEPPEFSLSKQITEESQEDRDITKDIDEIMKSPELFTQLIVQVVQNVLGVSDAKN